mmetsp:Transcript_20585/g.23778  ORF Transcript_20585/g.23778 Transcript_20585/m.23778 type:complete len:156 (+) Transcript_20585:57-524(+)
MTSQISHEQLMEFAEAFSLFDVDDTNTIAVQKLDCVLRTLGLVIPEARIAELVDRKLEEGEPHITFEEFLYLVGPANTSTWQHHDDMCKGRSGNLQKALGVFDTQGYGVISVVDLRRALRESLMDHEIDELVRVVDPKQTGRVEVQALSEYLAGY